MAIYLPGGCESNIVMDIKMQELKKFTKYCRNLESTICTTLHITWNTNNRTKSHVRSLPGTVSSEAPLHGPSLSPVMLTILIAPQDTVLFCQVPEAGFTEHFAVHTR